MIDFPASPTDGQVFSATNGVVYKWSATYSSWLAQNPAPPLGGTGDVDVMQTGAWTIPVAGSDTVMPFDTVLVGNAGLWWSTSTNRYTPPAGRYSLQAWAMFSVPAGVSAGIALRKNGVRTSAGYVQQNTGTVARTLSLNFNETVDANGC